MLCTPPAFILSQDQTLECFVLSRSLERYNHLRAFSLLFYFYFVCVFSLEFVRVLLRTFVFALYFSQADSLCFVVQFSMTGACSFPSGAVSVLRRLDYYITSHPACQAFFQTFSDFFSRLFLRSRVRFVRSLSLFPTAPILYPFSSPLSTLFSHLFWFFEKSFFAADFSYLFICVSSRKCKTSSGKPIVSLYIEKNVRQPAAEDGISVDSRPIIMYNNIWKFFTHIDFMMDCQNRKAQYGHNYCRVRQSRSHAGRAIK